MDGYDLSKVPLGMAPPGQTVNLAEGPSQAWMPRLAIYTTLPVAFGFLVLRLFARLRMRIPLGMDDCEYRAGSIHSVPGSALIIFRLVYSCCSKCQSFLQLRTYKAGRLCRRLLLIFFVRPQAVGSAA